jgi:hypothetical protein
MSRVRNLIVVAVIASRCAAPENGPVFRAGAALTTTSRPPEVIWVLDRSGSIGEPMDPSDPACTAGCQEPNCSSGCATRHSALGDWLDNMAAGEAGLARHSALLFPADQTCGVPGELQLAGVSLAEVATTYRTADVGGGTPTSETLKLVASLPVAPEAGDRWVVLVTDGQPNCNPDLPYDCSDAAACRCTVGVCEKAYCKLGCFDDTGLVAASAALATAGDHFVAVGVGPDAQLEQPLVEQLALEMPYEQTLQRADLTALAPKIAARLKESRRCVAWLDRDVPAEAFMMVSLGDRVLQEAEWTRDGRRIRVSGDACEALKSDETVALSVCL